jgi:hypothetical protein
MLKSKEMSQNAFCPPESEAPGAPINMHQNQFFCLFNKNKKDCREKIPLSRQSEHPNRCFLLLSD